MNNYCTNCGKKLEKDESVCRDCNIPIIDLPDNYDYESPVKKEKKKGFPIIVICILCVVAFVFAKEVSNAGRINRMEKDYVEPYLKEKYSNSNYSIKYESSGKCIISGDCVYDATRGCDGGTCQEYEYLDENDCKSYYYSIKTDTSEFIVTVVNSNNQFSVVEGRNIYGTDKESNEK